MRSRAKTVDLGTRMMPVKNSRNKARPADSSFEFECVVWAGKVCGDDSVCGARLISIIFELLELGPVF